MSKIKHIPLQKTNITQGRTREDKAFLQKVLLDPILCYRYQKICIFLVAFFVFANGIPNGFNVDDRYYTTDANPVASMGLKGIPLIFSDNTMIDNNGNHFDYRPVPMLTFALQHQFGGGSPMVGHFINVLLYALICLSLFLLLCRLVGPERHWLAFFAMLLYAVHPLHTEVVDSIKSRDELLATFFGIQMIASLWSWHRLRDGKYILAGVVFLLLGLLCKMTVVIYLAFLPVVFYFFTDIPLRKIAFLFLLLFVCGAVLKFGIKFALPSPHRVFVFFENPMYTDHAMPLAVKTATASYILGWYAWLHVVPYPLSFYYGYTYVQLYYWGVLPVISLVLHAGLVWLIIKGARKKTMLAFGAYCYLVGIILFSNLFGASPGMMAERFTFASSIGYCLLFVSAAYTLLKIAPVATFDSIKGEYMVGVFVLVSGVYAGMTLIRNAQWKDSWTLFSHDVQHLKNSAKVNMFYAEQVMFRMTPIRYMIDNTMGVERKKYQDSLKMFQQEELDAYRRVLEVAPDFYEALANLGVAYINLDSFEIARNYLSKARAVAPDNADIRSNLGVAFGRMGADKPEYLDSAVSEFRAALDINSKLMMAYGGLALVYLNKQDTGAAINISIAGTKHIPDDSRAYMQVAQIFLYKRDTAKAINYFEEGAQVPQPEPQVLQILEQYFHAKRDAAKENYYKDKLNRSR